MRLCLIMYIILQLMQKNRSALAQIRSLYNSHKNAKDEEGGSKILHLYHVNRRATFYDKLKDSIVECSQILDKPGNRTAPV